MWAKFYTKFTIFQCKSLIGVGTMDHVILRMIVLTGVGVIAVQQRQLQRIHHLGRPISSPPRYLCVCVSHGIFCG